MCLCVSVSVSVGVQQDALGCQCFSVSADLAVHVFIC